MSTYLTADELATIRRAADIIGGAEATAYVARRAFQDALGEAVHSELELAGLRTPKADTDEQTARTHAKQVIDAIIAEFGRPERAAQLADIQQRVDQAKEGDPAQKGIR